MKHLSRWRVVTAAAASAAVAAGAFGLSNAVSGPGEQPTAIELGSGTSSEELQVVTSADEPKDAAETATSVADQVDTVTPDSSPLSARSVDSPTDAEPSSPATTAGTASGDRTAAVAPSPSLDSPDDEPASPISPDSPDSPDDEPASPVSVDSPDDDAEDDEND